MILRFASSVQAIMCDAKRCEARLTFMPLAYKRNSEARRGAAEHHGWVSDGDKLDYCEKHVGQCPDEKIVSRIVGV